MESETVDWVVPPALADSIAGAVGYRSVLPPDQPHRGLPSPYLTVILTFGTRLHMLAHPSPDQPGGSFEQLIGGLHDTPALIDMGGLSEGIQLSLTPLGSRRLLGVPAGELARRDVHGWELLGQRASEELTERLAAADGWTARFQALEEFLPRRLRPALLPEEVAEALRLLRATGGRMSIGALARQVGLSPRRLGQLFATEVGLAPKSVARVSRFGVASRVMVSRHRTGQPLDLAELAVTTGFFDQAHLSREWVSIAGLAPTAWLAAEFRAEDFRSVQDERVPAAAG